LIIGEIVYGSESYLENLPTNVYFRAPLIVSLKPSSRGENPRQAPRPAENPRQGPGQPANPPISNPGVGSEVPGIKPPHANNFPWQHLRTDNITGPVGKAPPRQ